MLMRSWSDSFIMGDAFDVGDAQAANKPIPLRAGAGTRAGRSICSLTAMDNHLFTAVATPGITRSHDQPGNRKPRAFP
jgi:dihydroorotate dehydrogenase